MSLHLIESRKFAAADTRKRSGALASVLLHATLVTLAFTFATGVSYEAAKPAHDGVIYVAPPKVREAPRPQTPQSPAAPSAPRPLMTTLVELPDIPTMPTDIQVPNYTISDAIPPSRVSKDYGLGGTILGAGTCCASGSASVGAVLNDLEVDKPVQSLPGARAPRYPDMLRSAGVQDTVVATFVVDTLGRMESGSFATINSPNALFVAAVREALASTRFRPAEAGGRRVRQRVNQAFVFSLSR